MQQYQVLSSIVEISITIFYDQRDWVRALKLLSMHTWVWIIFQRAMLCSTRDLATKTHDPEETDSYRSIFKY